MIKVPQLRHETHGYLPCRFFSLLIPFTRYRAGSMVMTAEAAKTKGDRIDWKTVRGLMVDAIYGGRVDNPHDLRVLTTYLRQFFNSDVVSEP